MRERFDAGSGLVAVGAILLLVSLFIDWYRPGGDAWVVFEGLDLALAGAAIACLVGIAPRFAGLGRAVPVIALSALAAVIVQLISPPPAARASDLDSGAWVALAATVLMALGASLAAASISVTVDVRERERRRRTAAIDARERIFDEPLEQESDPADLEPASIEARAAARRAGRREQAVSPPPAPTPDSQAGEPEPEGPVEVAEDPQRTQAMEPVDRTEPT